MGNSQYRLVVRQGPNPGQIFELDKNEINIGRDIGNDIVINDAEVSRKHARLVREGDRYRIEDLNSTNGTYIDGQRLIGPHLLAVGEIIMFGDNIGVVFDGEPAVSDETVRSPIDLENTPVAAIPAPPEEAFTSPEESYTPPEIKVYPMPETPSTELEQEAPAEKPRKPVNTWLLACGGCLVVVLLVIIAFFIFIDQPWKPGGGLYCNPPFDIIFSALGYCP